MNLKFFTKISSFFQYIDVFENFESKGEFFCFVGQSSEAVTVMYNLFRAKYTLKFLSS